MRENCIAPGKLVPNWTFAQTRPVARPDRALAGAARYAVRADGIEHDSPASVLAVLNAKLLLGAGARFCTIVYGLLRPHGATDFRLTVACGAHPLPLVLRRSGGVETLGTVGSLVGVRGGAAGGAAGRSCVDRCRRWRTLRAVTATATPAAA